MADPFLLMVVFMGALGVLMLYQGSRGGGTSRGGFPRLGRRNILQERLRKPPERLVEPEPTPAKAGERASLFPGVSGMLQRTRLQPLLRQLESALFLAHVPLKPTEFLYITFTTIFLALVIIQLLTTNVALIVLVGVVSAIAPFRYLKANQRARFQRIDDQVSDALLLMTNSLRAGAGFLDAMDAVSREMPPPISEEFSRALRDISLGVTVDESFIKMSVRCRSEDLDLAVTAFKIQREIGGNLAEILENIATTIRERAKLRQEIRTLSAQGKLSGIILCGLPFVLTLVLHIMNPSYLQVLFTTEEGKMLLGMAIFLMIIGVFSISRMIRIQV